MANLAATMEDHGDHLRVVAIIFPRRNGLPNLACAKVAMAALERINPDAYDPIEGVPEDVARARLRDGALQRWHGSSGKQYASKEEAVANGEQAVSEDAMNWTIVDADGEIPGYRCANGACAGD